MTSKSALKETLSELPNPGEEKSWRGLSKAKTDKI